MPPTDTQTSESDTTTTQDAVDTTKDVVTATATNDDEGDDSSEDKSKTEDKTEDKGGSTKRKAADGDDVELDEKSMVSMPFTSFQKRLNRAAKSMMREVFGTDNVDELKKIMKDGKSAHDKIEKQRKEQLSEVEKAKESVEVLRKRAERAEEQLESFEFEKQASKGEQLVTAIANKHISADYLEDAVAVYQRHLSKLDADDFDDMSEKTVEQWFKEYAEKKPALARKPGERRKVTEPGTTGPDPKKKPDPTKVAHPEKVAKPGQVNSMSKAEWEDYKRVKGISY